MKITKQLFMFALVLLIPGLSANSQPKFPKEAGKTEEGFIKIFNGKDLTGWDGDPVYWSVKDGKIIGEITPETIVERNTFLIWRGGKPDNFELKLEYKISSKGNSGINYRSVEVEGVPWALKGYQADIDGAGRWTGQNYEERGRTFLALRGQITRAYGGETTDIIGSVGDNEGLMDYVNKDDWNEYHLIIHDNVLIHMINGHVMSIVTDQDEENRTSEGFIGVQVHVGPPMIVEYRNIRLKEL